MSSSTSKTSWTNPLSFVERRQYSERYISGVRLMKDRLHCARNLYRKDLFSHYGCVNAIEFSNDGEWLVSGGDDKRVLVWNVEKALQGNETPMCMKGEHGSNIFCLGFDNERTKIYSAGNDEQVIVHDFKSGTTLDVFLHEEAVYGISVDPFNGNVFASACEDGRILIWDIRENSGSEPFCLTACPSGFHAVMYNPVEPRLLSTANSREGVSLWDIRAPRKSCLLKYTSNAASESCMSVRFNSYGTQILALRRRLPPVLYDIHSPKPVCQFDHREYYNSSTMKSCCFAGDKDQYVLSGSDDFNLYMWKIPDPETNVTWVEEAHMVLKGHRSIVNQVRFNPSNFLLASSGVEKIVKLWSPFSLPKCTGGLNSNCPTADKERKIFSHEEYISLILQSGQVMSHDYSQKSTMEDPRMMAFFDSLVQREIEGWNPSFYNGNCEEWQGIDSENISMTDSSSESASDGELFVQGRGITCSSLAVAYDRAIVKARALEQRNTSTEANDEEQELREVNNSTNPISLLIAKKRKQLLRKQNRRKRSRRRICSLQEDEIRPKKRRVIVSDSSSSEDDSYSSDSNNNNVNGKRTKKDRECRKKKWKSKTTSTPLIKTRESFRERRMFNKRWRCQMLDLSASDSADEQTEVTNRVDKSKMDCPCCEDDLARVNSDCMSHPSTSTDKCEMNGFSRTFANVESDNSDTSSQSSTNAQGSGCEDGDKDEEEEEEDDDDDDEEEEEEDDDDDEEDIAITNSEGDGIVYESGDGERDCNSSTGDVEPDSLPFSSKENKQSQDKTLNCASDF